MFPLGVVKLHCYGQYKILLACKHTKDHGELKVFK